MMDGKNPFWELSNGSKIQFLPIKSSDPIEGLTTEYADFEYVSSDAYDKLLKLLKMRLVGDKDI